MLYHGARYKAHKSSKYIVEDLKFSGAEIWALYFNIPFDNIHSFFLMPFIWICYCLLPPKSVVVIRFTVLLKFILFFCGNAYFFERHTCHFCYYFCCLLILFRGSKVINCVAVCGFTHKILSATLEFLDLFTKTKAEVSKWIKGKSRYSPNYSNDGNLLLCYWNKKHTELSVSWLLC